LENIQKENLNIEIFQDLLIRNIEKKEKININNNNNNYDSAFNEFLSPNEKTGFLGNAEILKQQRREMEEILRQEEKAEKEKKKKIEEETFRKKDVIKTKTKKKNL
jgi:hypothetical protein